MYEPCQSLPVPSATVVKHFSDWRQNRKSGKVSWDVMGQGPSDHSMCPGVSWSCLMVRTHADKLRMSWPSGKWHGSWPWHTRTRRVAWGALTRDIPGHLLGFAVLALGFQIWSIPIQDHPDQYRSTLKESSRQRPRSAMSRKTWRSPGSNLRHQIA